jgi:thioredoxin reductase (NADPH)
MKRTNRDWDCVIVGGGPAGLSAAIYMARFLRRALVVDDGQGRWSYGQRNDNYLGFPRGVGARRLRQLGMAQALRFGAVVENATAVRVAHADGDFRVETTRGLQRARTVIWAAGVEDIWPAFSGARALVGKSLFWCIVCDGWRTLGKKVLLVGRHASAARTALQFLTYTPHLTFAVDPGPPTIPAKARAKLGAEGIAVRDEPIRAARAAGDGVEIRYERAPRERYDYVFSLLGSRPRIAGLAGLGVRTSRLGHVRVDEKNATSVPGLFACGDVTDGHAHQIASAVHEGASAAQAANFILYPPRQKLER